MARHSGILGPVIANFGKFWVDFKWFQVISDDFGSFLDGFGWFWIVFGWLQVVSDVLLVHCFIVTIFELQYP